MLTLKTIYELLFVALVLVLLFSVSLSYATDIKNPSDEIEKVETGENVKTVYYKDGHKEVYVSGSVDVSVGTSVGTASVTNLPTVPPKPLDITEIFKFIRQILDFLRAGGGVGCALLAWKIWNIIKKLRGNRPRDYYGVGTISK